MARILIVGGVAGGASTAARLRRMDESAEIVLFERGQYVSYANCGLPYYIGGVIKDRNRLFVQTARGFTARFRVEVRTGSEVVSIDRQKKTIRVKELSSGRMLDERYDKLVLAPGAEPIRPKLPGIDRDGIFTLRSVPDTDRIKEYIEHTRPARAVVVGAGFIGLEMAENLHRLGMEVSIVELANQVMAPLDPEMAAEVHRELRNRKVELHLGQGVKSFGSRGERITIGLTGGGELVADMVLLGIGVRPESTLAREAGLELGARGGIVVNEHLQTSDPSIYALGDAIEFPCPITGKPTTTFLAGPANKQARIVADNIARGNRRSYGGAVGTAIAKVFDLTVATTGLAEKALRAAGMACLSTVTHSGSHAGYYPGAKSMAFKLVYAPGDGRLLGAQIVGTDGVDKRIDVVAALLATGGTVRDLAEMEQAYAPPYSSAKDPVNIAGFVAENALDGLVTPIDFQCVAERDRASTYLLDVRDPGEFAGGSIQDAVNIPVNSLRERLGELPRDRRIIVYCGVGLRAYVACRILAQHGFPELANLSGGWRTWEAVAGRQDNPGLFDHGSAPEAEVSGAG